MLIKITNIIKTWQLSIKDSYDWWRRIQKVKKCPDNNYFRHVHNAGAVLKNIQVMHNGIKIYTKSYYGKGMMQLLKANRGVHEPQEEKIFDQVLKKMETGSVILELGSYWSFYSMWFLKTVKNGSAYLIEPNRENLNYGKKNFELNQLQGDFTHGIIGEQSNECNIPIITVDNFLHMKKISHLNILHADIQGSELEMLHGSKNCLKNKNIDYLFVSTHSESLHIKCQNFIESFNYSTVASIQPKDSFSVDGILVMQKKLSA